MVAAGADPDQKSLIISKVLVRLEAMDQANRARPTNNTSHRRKKEEADETKARASKKKKEERRK